MLFYCFKFLLPSRSKQMSGADLLRLCSDEVGAPIGMSKILRMVILKK